MEVDSESRKRGRGEIEEGTSDAPVAGADNDVVMASGDGAADGTEESAAVRASGGKRPKFVPSEKTLKRSQQQKDRQTASDWAKIKRMGKGRKGESKGKGKWKSRGDGKLAKANAEWAVGTAANKKDFLQHKNEVWEAYYKVRGPCWALGRSLRARVQRCLRRRVCATFCSRGTLGGRTGHRPR